MTLQSSGFYDISLGPFWYSTFLTSVWVWLYLASSVIMSAAHSVTVGWHTVRRLVDAERQPFLSLGVISILIATGFYLAAIPFVIIF